MKILPAVTLFALALCETAIAQQTWWETEPMQRARVESTAVLYNEELVVFNGFGTGLKIENSVEKFNFRNKRWELILSLIHI